MKTILILLATVGTTLGQYVPPTEDVPIFRRDTLLLDSYQQELLAQNLYRLATRSTALSTPKHRRATAQLLALVTTITPQSKGPANLNRSFASDEVDSSLLIGSQFESVFENVSKITRHLLESEDQANRELAHLLLDPFTVIAPQLEIFKTHPSPGESPKWNRAIAPLAAFKELPPPPAIPNTETKATSEENSENISPEQPQNPPEKPKPPIEVGDYAGSISFPALIPRASGKNTPKRPTLALLHFSGSVKANEGKIQSPLSSNPPLQTQVYSTLKSNLNREGYREVMPHIHGKFEIPEGSYHPLNKEDIALPMAILAQSLLNKKKLHPKLIVLGNLEADGKITIPSRPIEALETLQKRAKSSKPKRLLVSSELRPYLESILVQHNEEFFFAYDIFAVSTLEEALSLSFTDSDTAQISSALIKFQEIRDVGQDKKTSVFVANPHVLTRLNEVRKLDSRFLSPTLLQLRGMNKQPLHHSQLVLASLLKNSLEPLSKLSYGQQIDTSSESLTETHKICRERIDKIGNEVASQDRILYDKTINLINKARTLSRAKEKHEKGNINLWDKNEYRRSAFRSTIRSIQEDYYNTATEIAEILGESPPEQPKK